MRLLNTTTLKLESFADNAIPPYAILSHVWGPANDEVSFEDMQTDNADMKPGYAKLQKSCLVATSDSFKYIWIDTCCIQKSSSAELSEAINSMFRYYQNSEACYAFLADVSAATPDGGFAQSKWFTRGWTLQELIAPSKLQFLSESWTRIGTRADLACEISQITGINTVVLEDRTQLRKCSIAKRMSWASQRTTTREEDIAYSLMGIFEVNMPLLYGEGPKAFWRLQEEIMKISTDQSLLTWAPLDHDGKGPYSASVLARHPSDFSLSSNIVPYQSNSAFSMTNKGLYITLPIVKTQDNEYVAITACHRDLVFHGPVGIKLSPALGNEGEESFFRDGHQDSLVDLGDISSRSKNLPWQRARSRAIYILRERLENMQEHSYAWIRNVADTLELKNFAAGPQGNGSWDQSNRIFTWKGIFRTLERKSDTPLLGSISVVPAEQKLDPGGIVHFGIYRQNQNNRTRIQPCLYLASTVQAPRPKILNFPRASQLSDHRSHDWFWMTGTKAVCANIKRARVMDKQISVIDIWTVDIIDNLKLLLVVPLLLQVQWAISQLDPCSVIRNKASKHFWLLLPKTSFLQSINTSRSFKEAILFSSVSVGLVLVPVFLGHFLSRTFVYFYKMAGAMLTPPVDSFVRRSLMARFCKQTQLAIEAFFWLVIFSRWSTRLKAFITIDGFITTSLILSLSTIVVDTIVKRSYFLLLTATVVAFVFPPLFRWKEASSSAIFVNSYQNWLTRIIEWLFATGAQLFFIGSNTCS
jgi:hypothetical protein